MRSDFWAGAVLSFSALALFGAVFPLHIPSESPVGALARMLDNLMPVFLTLACLGGVATVMLGRRIMGCVLVVAAFLGGVGQLSEHRDISLPLKDSATPGLRVLFFNARGDNAAQAHRIADAVLAANADVVVIAEPDAIYSALNKLDDEYVFVSPCARDACQLLVASRQSPARFWRVNLNDVWPGRYAVAELTVAGRPVFVVANHLVKPWFSGISESEYARLRAQYNWLSLPSVVVGDFNSAPWSRPMRNLLQKTGMKTLRLPVGSWPSWAGRFALPVDQVLVHNGARVLSVEVFGRGLGSNHLGFVADIGFP